MLNLLIHIACIVSPWLTILGTPASQGLLESILGVVHVLLQLPVWALQYNNVENSNVVNKRIFIAIVVTSILK